MVSTIQVGIPYLANTAKREARHTLRLLEPGLSDTGPCYRHTYSERKQGRVLNPSVLSDLFGAWRALNSQEFTLLTLDDTPEGWDKAQPWRLEGHDYYTFDLGVHFPEALALPMSMRTVGQVVDAGLGPITFDLKGNPIASCSVFSQHAVPVSIGVVCVGPDRLVYFIDAGEPQPKWVEPTRPSLADKIFSSSLPLVDNRIYSSKLNEMIPLTKHTGGGPTAAHCFGGEPVRIDHPASPVLRWSTSINDEVAGQWCKRLQETLNI